MQAGRHFGFWRLDHRGGYQANSAPPIQVLEMQMVSKKNAGSSRKSVWIGPLLLFTIGVALIVGMYLYYRHWRDRKYVEQCVFVCSTIAKHLKSSNDPAEYVAPPLEEIFKNAQLPAGTQIRRGTDGRLVDAWGNAFVIRTVFAEEGAKLKITVTSKGPDGELDTDPDYTHTYTIPVPQTATPQ